ncbi:MAG: HD domain-containing protein [Candidatus Absconditabacterales bacterium]
MLNFNNLEKLNTHINYLEKKIKKQNIFLVGGCIRDMILGIEDNPKDIDFTMAGIPNQIYKNLDKTGISHFMTEKFGTITIIKKINNEGEKLKKLGKPQSNNKVILNSEASEASVAFETLETLKYELTPFRTEGGYEDFRHPGKINRSNDLILDSNRRDFTINSIYYFLAKISDKKILTQIKSVKLSSKDMFDLLDANGLVYVKNLNLLILQDHQIISKLFKNGIFNLSEMQNVTKLLQSSTINLNKKNSKSDNLSAFSGNLSDLGMKIIIDPHKGIQDLNIKKLKAVGIPDNRFQEDALRIIRALRFVNVLNQKLQNLGEGKNLFDFQKETRISVKKNYKLLTKVAKERIKEELTKVFEFGNPFGFISLLDETNLLKFLFPSLFKTKNIDQPVRYHPFDVYVHTLLTLYELQKINENYLVRFAMLYHDVGKVNQFKEYKNGLDKEAIRKILSGPLNHRISGPELTKKDFNFLGFSNKEINEICRYVKNHHKPEEILFAKEENKLKKARNFLSETGFEKANNLLDICIADRIGSYNPLQSSGDVSDVYKLKTIIKNLNKKEGQFTLKKLAVNGNDIIKFLKIKSGPKIGEMLRFAFKRVINDISNRNNKQKILDYIKKVTKVTGVTESTKKKKN